MESSTQQAEANETEGKLIHLGHLQGYLKQVTDGRKKRGLRYLLETVLILVVLGKLCGQNKIYGIADWAQQHKTYLLAVLGLKYEHMPHHSTYRRVLGEEVGSEEFERIMKEYWEQVPGKGHETVIAIDGKTVRGTITAEDPFGLHLLAAYLPGEGIVLMQMIVEKEKENEIVVAPKLLGCLDLRNKVVVGDAMQTQRQLSVHIVAAGGEFVWIVKDNQPNTREAIARLFAPEPSRPGFGNPAMDFRSAKTVDKQAGRIEERTLITSSLLNDYVDWPHLGQVFKLERRFTCLSTGIATSEIQYGLTSLTAQEASPVRLLAIVRSEWGIENGLHYRRDVTFQEDATRMTVKSLARVMTTINNLVIGLLNQRGYKNHAHARRVFSANPAKAFALISGL